MNTNTNKGIVINEVTAQVLKQIGIVTGFLLEDDAGTETLARIDRLVLDFIKNDFQLVVSRKYNFSSNSPIRGLYVMSISSTGPMVDGYFDAVVREGFSSCDSIKIDADTNRLFCDLLITALNRLISQINEAKAKKTA
jgi:hypothetical protein